MRDREAAAEGRRAARLAGDPGHGARGRGRQALRLGHRRPTSPTRCSPQTGVELDRRKIVLDEPIRELGDVEVPVRLHAEVVVVVAVAVVAE